MVKTSHKRHRPFDFKLIDLVECNPVLYRRQVGVSTYECMKMKTEIWKEIGIKMGTSAQFCMSRWSNLRGQFQKEVCRRRYVCPKLGVIRGSTWPYIERLKFLENTVKINRPKKISKNEDISAEKSEWRSDSVVSECEEKYASESEEKTEENVIVSPVVKVEIRHPIEGYEKRITLLLNNMDNINRERVERRIMAFLCKCQLKALINEDVDDLYV